MVVHGRDRTEFASVTPTAETSIGALRDNSPILRAAGLSFIERYQLPLTEVQICIVAAHAMMDPHMHVRIAALRALVPFTGRVAIARQAIVASFHSADDKVRGTAYNIIINMTEGKDIVLPIFFDGLRNARPGSDQYRIISTDLDRIDPNWRRSYENYCSAFDAKPEVLAKQRELAQARYTNSLFVGLQTLSQKREISEMRCNLLKDISAGDPLADDPTVSLGVLYAFGWQQDPDHRYACNALPYCDLPTAFSFELLELAAKDSNIGGIAALQNTHSAMATLVEISKDEELAKRLADNCLVLLREPSWPIAPYGDEAHLEVLSIWSRAVAQCSAKEKASKFWELYDARKGEAKQEKKVEFLIEIAKSGVSDPYLCCKLKEAVTKESDPMLGLLTLAALLKVGAEDNLLIPFVKYHSDRILTNQVFHEVKRGFSSKAAARIYRTLAVLLFKTDSLSALCLGNTGHIILLEAISERPDQADASSFAALASLKIKKDGSVPLTNQLERLADANEAISQVELRRISELAAPFARTQDSTQEQLAYAALNASTISARAAAWFSIRSYNKAIEVLLSTPPDPPELIERFGITVLNRLAEDDLLRAVLVVKELAYRNVQRGDDVAAKAWIKVCCAVLPRLYENLNNRMPRTANGQSTESTVRCCYEFGEICLVLSYSADEDVHHSATSNLTLIQYQARRLRITLPNPDSINISAAGLPYTELLPNLQCGKRWALQRSSLGKDLFIPQDNSVPVVVFNVCAQKGLITREEATTILATTDFVKLLKRAKQWLVRREKKDGGSISPSA